MSEPILDVRNVHVDYHLDEGIVQAVRGVTYKVYADEILSIVGESGCGKSQSSYAAMGLIQPPGMVSKGNIFFSPSVGEPAVDLLKYERNSKQIRAIRGGKLAMIFQEPMTALSPVHRIGAQLDEVLKLHTNLNKHERRLKAYRILAQVGIPDSEKRYAQYSFEFSGGMRQRIMIAIALACNPRLLIADEPTTGLDVTIQAQILDLIKEIQQQHHIGVVLITHDLAVVAETAHRVAVMYLGRIIEQTDIMTLFKSPKHPYTDSLLRSVIGSPLASDGKLQTIKGSVPGPLEIVSGCPFHPRCDKFMQGICDRIVPPVKIVDNKTTVACHLYQHEPDAPEIQDVAL